MDAFYWALAGAAGVAIGLLIARLTARAKTQAAAETAKVEAEAILQKARGDAEHISRDAQLAAKDELLKLRNENEKRLEGDRQEVRERDRVLQKKEQTLDERDAAHEKRQRMLTEVEATVAKRQELVRQKDDELSKVLEEQRAALTHTAGLTVEEARTILLDKIRLDVAEDETRIIAKSEERIKATVEIGRASWRERV